MVAFKDQDLYNIDLNFDLMNPFGNVLEQLHQDLTLELKQTQNIF